ncbi:Tat pathway signal sequence domain protein, partial [Streptomyces sp. WAC 05379]
MAEIIQRDGTWAFDGTTVRITPGLHRSVPLFRQTYGEIAVPLEAVAGIVFEPERKRGRLRMRLREGADPLLHATGGRLPDTADPYRLAVDVDRAGVAEYVAEEIRRALLLDQIPKDPTKTYL